MAGVWGGGVEVCVYVCVCVCVLVVMGGGRWVDGRWCGWKQAQAVRGGAVRCMKRDG